MVKTEAAEVISYITREETLGKYKSIISQAKGWN